MFGIGVPELIVILVVALVVLGPKRLPEVARQLGKVVAEFRRQSAEIMDELQHASRSEPPPRRKPPKPATTTATTDAKPEPTDESNSGVA